MYYRTEDFFNFIGNKICFDDIANEHEITRIGFNTYFNSFNVGKWKKYTNINSLNFKFKFSGNIKIVFYKAKMDMGSINKEILFNQSFVSKEVTSGAIDLEIDDFSIRDDVYFEIVFFNENSSFSDAGYYAVLEEKLLNTIKLGIASCTYKKEKYILKTLNLLQKYVYDEYPDFNLSTYIVDNACSLDPKSLEGFSNLTLIESENLGASGGFSRGFYESIKSEDTHVISLDDDILLNPHSVVLLYNFLCCMKPEFLEHSIGGAMLIYDKKHLQHDSGAYIEKNKLRGIKSHVDLRRYDNCLNNSIEEYYNKTFNGFWFCCYPTKTLKERGLTIPFFMKGDDVELGIRIFNKKLITVNGICTWHEDFHKKFTPVFSNFYELRNLLIINSIEFEDYSAYDACMLFTRRAFRELMFYRYDGALLVCKAVETYLTGIESLTDVDNAQTVKDNLIYPLKDISECEDDFSYSKYLFSISNTRESKLRRFMRVVTFNGHILPNFLLKKSVTVPIVTSSFRSIFRYKKVVNYSFDNNKAYITEINKLRFISCLFKIFRTNLEILFKFNNARKSIKENIHNLATVASWEKVFNKTDKVKNDEI